jgi:hypothetical protein
MKRKTLRLAGLLCLLCIAAVILIGYKIYNKPHRSVTAETAVIITAAQLAEEYEKDEINSNKKYLDKALQVSGVVSEISFNQQNKPVILLNGSDMSGVQCTLQEAETGIKKGDSISVKGFCTGYLTDVIINRCVIAQ